MRSLGFIVVVLLALNAHGHFGMIIQSKPSGEWRLVEVPQVWKRSAELSSIDNREYGWFRAQVKLPESFQGDELELFVEPQDDARQVYFNGVRVGGFGDFPPAFRSGLGDSPRHKIPARLAKATNVVAIRVFRDKGRGNFNVAAPVIFSKDQAIRLQGKWQFRKGDQLAWATESGLGDSVTYSKVEPRSEVERTLRKLSGEDGPKSIKDAAPLFQIAEDLEWKAVLGDPDIGQPLSIKFDDRGRLWVVEYRQYPNPAGLKMISRDKYLRSVYDKTPPAPPNHFKGKDRITIHEDSNGDGYYDKHKTFVSGLSLVSSFAIGRGGVWVLNPPYLLFYPDRDGDDQPDGDPQVLLQGFGIEDSHSIANSLRWGPDGWLYGAQGSTVSGQIRKPGSKEAPTHSMGQLIWRYHPTRKTYEVFAEGGGNSFGVEIDQKGRVYSGHNGGNTRGFHYVQGGYYQKGFGKHGALSNPYSFGYFPFMKHPSVPRFTHTFVINEGNGLPKKYDGILFGVGPLQGHVVMSQVSTDGSSFQTKDLGHPVQSKDTWFRPVDIQLGPDGAIYVADLYEQRIDHASHYQGRVDITNGRVYRLSAKGLKHPAKFDLSKLSDTALIESLFHPNRWMRQSALRVIGDRKSPAIAGLLSRRLAQSTGTNAVNALWGIYLSDAWSEEMALAALDHDDPHVRAWAVRYAGDEKVLSPGVLARCIEMARDEPNVEVRSQLACSARRIPTQQALPILKLLVSRGEDAKDIHIPLLLWWAFETHTTNDSQAVVKMFNDDTVWGQSITKQVLLERLMRRLAQSGTRGELLAAARLLSKAPDKPAQNALLKGFEAAYQGRSLTDLPKELLQAIGDTGGGSLALRVRQGNASAIDEAISKISNNETPAAIRAELLRILGQIRHPSQKLMLKLALDKKENAAVRIAAVVSLQHYGEDGIAHALLNSYKQFAGDLKSVVDTLLVARVSSAQMLVDHVANGAITKDLVASSTVRKILLHPNKQLKAAVEKQWGTVKGATTEEMKKQIAKFRKVLSAGTGNPYQGKVLYKNTCGKCHQLFDDGGNVGPNLTAFKRDDQQSMLLNIVNPSIEIRKGYETYVVYTDDGRALNGFIADQDNQVVVLKGLDSQAVVIPRAIIDEMSAVPQSIMPEGLLQKLKDQEIRDLFAYLRATQPLP